MKDLIKPRVFLILFFFLYVYSFAGAQVDSTYIGFFDKELSLKMYLQDKFTSISHQEGKSGDEISYHPNAPYGIELGITYKGISLSGAYGFDFMRDKKRGKTRSMDFQYHHYGRKFVLDIFFQQYKGFYQEVKTEQYEHYPDIRLRQYGGFAQYVFNGNRFSYSAAFSQNQKQLKSTGSFLLGGGIYYNEASSDGSLKFNDKNDINNFQFGVSAGYAYTWVINKRVFISGSVSVGANVGAEDMERLNGKNDWKVYPTVFPRFSSGYNHDNWSIGMSFVLNRVYIVFSEQSKIAFNTGVVQFTYIKRFDAIPKFKRK